MGIDALTHRIPSLPPWLIEELEESERALRQERPRPELHIEQDPAPSKPSHEDEGAGEAPSRVIVIPL